MDKKALTRKELQQFDGKDGRPAYIVHKGRVIDVSGSKLWNGGVHMMRHQAGQDLTMDIEAAPHGLEVLERYPQVGELVEEEVVERRLPDSLSGLLSRYPILARHPHPMMVHFPTVFFLAAGFFSILYVFTKHQPFETTGFHSLCGGLFFTPFAMATGFFTWWLNYAAKRMRPTTIKIFLASVTLPVATAVVLWRFFVPHVLIDPAGPGILYLLLVIALSPLVLIISYYGGTLTFPVRKAG